MTGLMRRARHAAEADARQLRQEAEVGLVTLIDTGEAVFTGDREESVAGLRERIGADRLEKALMACRAVAANDARGVVDAVIARYPDLRKSLPAFWSLPFASDTGRDDLLMALDLVRRLDRGVIKILPDDAPTDFVPAGWQNALRDDRGRLRRSLWETALSRDSWFDQRKDDALSVQLLHGLVNRVVERFGVGKGLMRQVVRLEIMPDHLDVVEFRRILRQPLDGEPVCAGGKRRHRDFARVDRAIVLDEHHRLDGLTRSGAIKPVELLKVGDEVATALGRAGVDGE